MRRAQRQIAALESSLAKLPLKNLVFVVSILLLQLLLALCAS